MKMIFVLFYAVNINNLLLLDRSGNVKWFWNSETWINLH